MEHEQRVEGDVKEAAKKQVKKYWKSKNKIQDGTTSTLGSLDSPHLRHPRIGKPGCSLYLEISGKKILKNCFFLMSVKNLFLSKVSVAAKFFTSPTLN